MSGCNWSSDVGSAELQMQSK
eukprot:gene26576-biopygen16907